jgi:hypothetical protein
VVEVEGRQPWIADAYRASRVALVMIAVSYAYTGAMFIVCAVGVPCSLPPLQRL